MKKFLLVLLTCLCGFAFADAAQAQSVVKLTIAQAVNANGSVTPTLTWCTEKTQSTGTTCSGTPASACTASGSWTGTKAAAGTETLPTVTTTANYVLQCSWPGSDSFTVNWTTPLTNTDGTTIDDLAGIRVYYSTSAAMSQNTIKSAPANATSLLIGPGLAPATYYVVVSSYNTPGAESVKVPVPPLSRVVGGGTTITGSVKVAFPSPPTGVTLTP